MERDSMTTHFDELKKSLSSDGGRVLNNVLSSSGFSSDFFKMEEEGASLPVKRPGEKVRIACLDIGSYRPEEMVWKVDGEHVLVQGKRTQRISKGVEGAKFSRAIPIPDGVDPKRISSRFSTIDGQYIIEGVKFATEQRPKRRTSRAFFDEVKMKLSIDLGDAGVQEFTHDGSNMNHVTGNIRVLNAKTDKIVI